MTYHLSEHRRQPNRCLHQNLLYQMNVVKYYQGSTLLDEVHGINVELILENNHLLVYIDTLKMIKIFLCALFIFHLPKTAKIPLICMFYLINGQLTKTNLC